MLCESKRSDLMKFLLLSRNIPIIESVLKQPTLVVDLMRDECVKMGLSTEDVDAMKGLSEKGWLCVFMKKQVHPAERVDRNSQAVSPSTKDRIRKIPIKEWLQIADSQIIFS